MKFAYADPPYLGQAKKHYAREAAADGRIAAEVDHAELIGRLTVEFPDGWALSCSSPSLRTLLSLCPEGVRVGAWVKPFHVIHRGVRPSYGWEPVVFHGGRNPPTIIHAPPEKGGTATTPRDWVAASITMRRGFPGAKPYEFCAWVFDLLGARPGDDFHDLFPGSGAVSRAWVQWQAQRPLDEEATG